MSICVDLIIKKVNAKKNLILRCKLVLLFLVTGKYDSRTEEVVSLAMLMSKMAASNTVPPFLTHSFDEVSVWSLKIPSNKFLGVCNTFYFKFSII